MAGPYDYNLQLSSDFTDQEYAPPLIDQNTNISGAAPGGSVTTIDGDSGGGAVGPIVTFSAGVTGYGFQAVGTSVTMTLTSAATARTALGLSKNNVALIDPTVADDNTLGYSVNSLWTNTAGPRSFICQDASTGSAVWGQINP